MSDSISFFRYEFPIDSTIGKDETLLYKKNENIKIINKAVADEIINSRLIEKHPEAKIEYSLSFSLEEVDEITNLAMKMGTISNTIEYNYGLLSISTFLEIEPKFYEITDEAKEFLITDSVLAEVIYRILDKVDDILTGRRYKIELYVSRDMEMEGWKEFIFSIRIDEKDFKKIVELWDEVEAEAEKIINNMEMERIWEIPHIERVNEILSIEMGRLENV